MSSNGIVCPAELLSALVVSFVGAPLCVQGSALTKEVVPQFMRDAFPGLSEAHVAELENILVSHMALSDGIVSPEVLDKFLSDLALHSPQEDPHSAFYEVIMKNLGTDEVDMLRDAFIHMDMDSDGFVSLEEMLHVVRTVVGDEKFSSLSEYLQPIFIVADKDRDGKLSLTEFLLSFAEGPGVVPTDVVNACVSSIRVRLTDEEIFALQERFRKIDTNGDGYIDTDELLVGLKEALGNKFPEPNEATFVQILNVVMALADTDHDGRLSLSEFIRSFQEDQGVLPAVFIDTRSGNSLRQFTPTEESIIRSVFSSLDGDVMDVEMFADTLTRHLSDHVPDKGKLQELCELILSSVSVVDGMVQLGEYATALGGAASVPFATVEDRIAKVLARLLELLGQDEVSVLLGGIATIQPRGCFEISDLSAELHSVVSSSIAPRGDEFISHITHLLVSTGEINPANTSEVSIDALIRVAQEHIMPVEEFSAAPVCNEPLPTRHTDQLYVPSANVQAVSVAAAAEADTACPITDTQLKREFDRYDTHGNGFLDREAFKQAFMAMEHFGVEPTMSEVNELFSRYSRGQDVIYYPEFTVIMLHRSKM